MVNALVLTPLPGTQLFTEMEHQGRIKANQLPWDWQYYTFALPVAEYKNFSWEELFAEKMRFHDIFYTYPRVLLRTLRTLWRTWNYRKVLYCLVGNLSYQYNHLQDRKVSAARFPATD
jgi:hypothetical protein